MKKFLLAALLGTMAFSGLNITAQARDTKHAFYDWGSKHWDTLDFKPYVTTYDRTHRPMNRYQAWPFASEVAPDEAINGLRKSKILDKFYIDEDSWQILIVEQYDNRDQLWRVSEGLVMNFYDVPNIWTAVEVHTDLQAGRYLALGLFNESQPYKFNADDITEADFFPAALRREGKR